MSWQADLERKYGSDEKAALHFLPLWRKKDRKHASKITNPSSLANKLRDLKAGKSTGWWKKRDFVLQLVAADLGVEVEELLGGPLVLGDALAFPEFPGLRPLAFNDEPCSFGPSGWLLHRVLVGLTVGGKRWVCAPAGAGKTLVRRYLNQRHDREYTALTVDTLEDATAHADSRLPLVIEVEMQDVASETSALGVFSRRLTPTVIMAPFVPFGSEAGSQWFRGDHFRPLAPRRFTHPALASWEIEEPPLPDGWRADLANWVDHRIDDRPDTKFDRQRLLDWLAECDPEEVLVPTPGDLLALCDEMHLHAFDDLGIREMAARWSRRVLAQPTGANADAIRWSRRVGVSTYAHLVARRALSPLPLDRGLDVSGWSALVPAARTPDDAAQPGGDIVVSYMRELGLLRGTEDGGLSLVPRWVVAGLAEAAVVSALGANSIHDWGRINVDLQRRAMVDRALDALSLGDLNGLVRSVLQHRDLQSLGAAGAIEATFSALARRLGNGRSKPGVRDQPLWLRIVELQVLLLLPEPSYRELLVPTTRPDLTGWIGDAWTISLSLPRPPWWQDSNLIREFPGWAGTFGLHDLDTWHQPSSPRILRLAPHVLRRCSDTSTPTTVPRYLVPAFIEIASEKGWEVRKEQVLDLLKTKEADYLEQHLRAAASPAMIERWWSHLSTLGDDLAAAIEVLEAWRPRLLRLLLDQLSEQLFERSVTTRGFAPSLPAFRLLPGPFRRVVLRHWAKPSTGTPFSLAHARELLPVLTLNELDELLETIPRVELSAAAEFAAAVWRLNPERARREAESAAAGSDGSLEPWFWSAPKRETPRLTRMAKDLPAVPVWLARWARSRFEDGEDAGDLLYRLLRAHPHA